jgi:hypothetical protein
VKGVIDGNRCEVKDDEIISFNFPTKLDKGVKVTSTFYRSGNDSMWRLGGKMDHESNKKILYRYRAGRPDRRKRSFQVKAFSHLEELNLAEILLFTRTGKNSRT